MKRAALLCMVFCLGCSLSATIFYMRICNVYVDTPTRDYGNVHYTRALHYGGGIPDQQVTSFTRANSTSVLEDVDVWEDSGMWFYTYVSTATQDNRVGTSVTEDISPSQRAIRIPGPDQQLPPDQGNNN
jgi:hypothetical protein